MGLINRIYARILQELPPQSFVNAVNKYEEWLNIYDEHEICFINNDDCKTSDYGEKKAIGSHLISKSANLKPISKNNKVKMVQTNYKNPSFSHLNDISIKSATKFPGFCKYHDKKIFEPIENKQISNYTNEHFLLLCLRVTVQKRYFSKIKNKKTKKILNSFNDKIVQNMLKQTISHNFNIHCANENKHKNIFRYFIYFIKTYVSFYCENIIIFKTTKENYNAFDKISHSLLKALNEKNYNIIKFKQIKIETNKIAFSSVQFIPIWRNSLYLFLFVLPNKNGSNILIGCLDEQYELLQKDINISKCFDGDLDAITKLIMLEKQEIIFNGNSKEDLEYFEMCLNHENQPVFDLFPPNLLE